VQDNIPRLLTGWTWSCLSQNGGASGCNGTGSVNANFSDTVDLPKGGSNIVYSVSADIHAYAVGLLTNTARVIPPAGYTDSNSSNDTATDTNYSSVVGLEEGGGDGDVFEISDGSVIFYLTQPISPSGNAAYDFVFYEWPNPPGIHLDHVIIDISSDGSNWHRVFNWGDGTADTNTNVDINLPNINSACVPAGTEQDNCQIPSAELYFNTGITINIDGYVPPNIGIDYHWIRFTAPTGDAAQIDAIQILTP
jgi:hypothetical protein